MRTIARALAVLVVLAGGPLAASTLGASASEQLVSGTVAPVLGIGLDPASATSGTASASVSRVLRGDTLYVTVAPAG